MLQVKYKYMSVYGPCITSTVKNMKVCRIIRQNMLYEVSEFVSILL
jgi:hypothetical protein